MTPYKAKFSADLSQLSQTRLSSGSNRVSLTGSADTHIADKASASFVHYGWLIIEWIGAHGVPLDMICELREKLVGPGVDPNPFLKKFVKEQHIYGREYPMGTTARCTGTRPKSYEREQDGWPPNAVLDDFALDCEVRPFECSKENLCMYGGFRDRYCPCCCRWSQRKSHVRTKSSLTASCEPSSGPMRRNHRLW
jgi:hypothetical protein